MSPDTISASDQDSANFVEAPLPQDHTDHLDSAWNQQVISSSSQSSPLWRDCSFRSAVFVYNLYFGFARSLNVSNNKLLTLLFLLNKNIFLSHYIIIFFGYDCITMLDQEYVLLALKRQVQESYYQNQVRIWGL